MHVLSISELARFSGIKPHTIRAWEQRYAALKPNRSEGNTRYYDGNQLRRLLNIVSLLEADHKISELAPMPDSKLFSLVRKVRNRSTAAPTKYFVPQLIAAGKEYDAPAFERILSHCLLRYGVKRTYVEILCPMLVQIGLLWSTNEFSSANEHFISNIVRQKLYVSIDSLPPSTQETPTWVLFLPENEFHDIGLLMANYLLKLSGKNTIYLGANSPPESVIQTLEDVNAENLFVFFTHNDDPEKIQAYLEELKRGARRKKLYAAGNTKLLEKFKHKKSIITIESIEELEAISKL